MSDELRAALESYDALYAYYQDEYVFLPDQTVVNAYNSLVEKYRKYNENLEYLDFDEEFFMKGVRALNKDVPVFKVSSKTGEGYKEIAQWLAEKANALEMHDHDHDHSHEHHHHHEEGHPGHVHGEHGHHHHEGYHHGEDGHTHENGEDHHE